jgi:hypothetical protein
MTGEFWPGVYCYDLMIMKSCRIFELGCEEFASALS